MERILCLAAGYVFGLFQTGYIYGKLRGVDIRKYGSGNLGSTNALRVLGARAGAVVFAGDVLKTLIPCAIVRLLFSSRPEAAYAFMLLSLIHISPSSGLIIIRCSLSMEMPGSFLNSAFTNW